MSASEMDIAGFLGHNNAGKLNRLNDWKKKKGAVNTFLHRKSSIVAVWRHAIPMLVTVKRDGRDMREVWFTQQGCHESESVLFDQNKRNPDGTRQKPPCNCGVCKLQEHIRGLILGGELPWLAPLFRFEGDERAKTQTRHAGGVCDMFKGDKLTNEEKQAIRDAGLMLTTAWQESFSAKLNYIFVVVDADNVAGGVQVATEPGLLGDKVKLTIRREMKSEGEDAGNPLKNPYCIRWESHPEEKEFNKKYDALRVNVVKPTPEIIALLNSPPPDISRELKKMEQAVIGAALQKACNPEYVNLIPFEELFTGGSTDTARAQVLATPVAPPAPVAEASDDIVQCDACGKDISISDAKCSHCGYEYEVTKAEPEPPPPPPPPVRKRSEVMAERAAAAKAAPAKPMPPPPAAPFVDAQFTPSDDDIPF